jgi:hypothetical protein
MVHLGKSFDIASRWTTYNRLMDELVAADDDAMRGWIALAAK